MTNRLMLFTDGNKAEKQRKEIETAINILEDLKIKLNTVQYLQETINFLKNLNIEVL